MKFKLSREQLNYALNLAVKRHDAKHSSFRNKDVEEFRNESKNKLSEKFKVDHQYMSHFLGVIGELGWSLVSGDTLDENIYSVRDDGQDFEGIEVKTITYMGAGEPELKITLKEYEQRKPPELYVLTRFNLRKNEIDVLGKISRETFDEVKTKKRYGYNKPMNYIVPLSEMQPV